MSSSYIPRSAEMVGHIECRGPAGVSRMTAYRGLRSRGYRSNYQHEPCYWIRLQLPGELTQQWSLVPMRFAEHVRRSKRDLAKGPNPGYEITHVEGVYVDAE